MKVHIGMDGRGIVHSPMYVDAAEADPNQLPNLIHTRESEIYGDGWIGTSETGKRLQGVGVRYQVIRRGYASGPLAGDQPQALEG